MPANTSRAGLPYPLGTDLQSEGDDTIKALAERLDGSVGALASVPFAMAAGQVNLSISAGNSGTAAVTFPVGRFTIAPLVFCGIENNPPFTPYMVRPSAVPTTTGFTAVVNIPTTTTGTVAIGWLAVQMTNSGTGWG